MNESVIVHDVIVIGGGSSGYAAARTARDAGADVAIVDHGPLGGLCILRGCMPSKTILRSAEVMALMRRAKEFGLPPVEARAELSAIVDRKDRLVREFADYRIKQLRDPQFTLYQERATFRSPRELQVGDRTLTATSFVISTGSVPCHVPIPGLDAGEYMTSDDILDLRRQPESLLVLGGGAVAVEFGQFFARIGTRVTILQRGATLLSYLDEGIGREVEAAFRDEGLTVYPDAQVVRFMKDGPVKTAHFLHEGRERSATGHVILQALGRQPNIDGLNLEAAGVAIENGRIVVTDDMRTAQPHIFAVGDVNDLNPIVHIAIQQGEIAAYNATHPHQQSRLVDTRLNAEVIFTDPQVAVVGLGERECQTRAIPYLTASYPFADHGKAMCLGATHGFVKLLCVPQTGELLGAQIIGPEAGELIHELIAVMYYHGTARDLLRMPHYHPTLAEIITHPAEAIVEQLCSGIT